MRCQILINFKVISLMAFFCIYVKFTYHNGACQYKFITTSDLKYRYVLYQMFIFIIHLVVFMCQNTCVFSLK